MVLDLGNRSLDRLLLTAHAVHLGDDLTDETLCLGPLEAVPFLAFAYL